MSLSPTTRRFVLVTGMPRSGTTAVGSALASASRSASYYEPLNPLSGLRCVDEWFVFPNGSGASAPLARVVDDVLRVPLRLKPGLWDADPTWRKAVKRVTGSRSRVSALRCRLDPTLRTIVWKDPFASFVVPYLIRDRDLATVVTVRSPEAAAASFKRLRWGFDVTRLSRELAPLTPGAAYLDEDYDDPARVADPATNGALVWRLLYGYLDHVLSQDSDLLPMLSWANTRSLIADPDTAYARLFAAVGLDYDDRARRHVEREHRDEGTNEPSAKRAHDRHRNVNQANDYWSRTLDDHEVALVRRVTAGVRARIEDRAGPL